MAARFKIIHDTNANVADMGAMYMHCGKCLKELPEGKSPKLWAWQQCAVTPEGWIQVWCVRHECNISLMKIEPKGKGDGA